MPEVIILRMKLAALSEPAPGMSKLTLAMKPGMGTESVSRIHWPRRNWASQTGTFVTELVIQQAAMAKGTFARTRMAMIAAAIICNGMSIIEKKRPMAKPEATVSRQGFQRLRWNNGREMLCHHRR